MYPSSILFVLATAVGLINAVAIPQAGEEDTCIREYGELFAGAVSPGPAQCTGCAAAAVTAGVIVWGGNPDNVEAAKQEYNESMLTCHGPEDETYNTCVKEYGEIFAGEPSASPVECTGCAAYAVTLAAAVYQGNPDNIEAAKETYRVEMAACSAPQ